MSYRPRRMPSVEGRIELAVPQLRDRSSASSGATIQLCCHSELVSTAEGHRWGRGACPTSRPGYRCVLTLPRFTGQS